MYLEWKSMPEPDDKYPETGCPFDEPNCFNPDKKEP